MQSFQLVLTFSLPPSFVPLSFPSFHSLAFSPSGTNLAAGDVKEVRVWSAADWTPLVKGKWQFHTSRVTGVAWNSTGEYVASAGTDENVFVWSLAKKTRRLQYKFAHKGGCTGIDWVGEGKILTAGGDGCVCEWNVEEEMREKFK